MIKELQYKGYATEPSDYECPDGQLATSLNLINEDEQLKPVFKPQTIREFPEGDEVIFVHKTTAFSHYIIKRAGSPNVTLLWLNENEGTEVPATYNGIILSTLKNVLRILSVGNTLVILSEDGLHYILWRSTDNNYSYLGQSIPEINMQFTTSAIYPDSYDRGTIETTDTSKKYYAAWRTTDEAASDCCTINSQGSAVAFKEEKQAKITQSIWALINQTNAQIAKSGHFYAPFLVRYCYRLYDGSMFMHSAPVYMPLSAPQTYYVEIPNIFSYVPEDKIKEIKNSLVVKEENDQSQSDFRISNLTFRYRPTNIALQYRCVGDVTRLKENWGDIVKSVDIFVSLPLVRESGATDEQGNFDEKIKTASRDKASFYAANHNLQNRYYDWCLNGDSNYPNDVVCDIPMLSDEAFLDRIKNVGNFYKVCSLNLDTSFSSSWQEVPINKSVLPVLATQELMEDDYKSRNTLLPSYDKNGKCISFLYNYNSRLNISGIKEQLFNGFGITSLLPLAYDWSNNINVRQIIVYLNTEEGEKIVINRFVSELSVSGRLLQSSPLFYPDNRAVKMIVQYRKQSDASSIARYAELPMDACPLINGAYTKGCILPSDTYTFVEPTTTVPAAEELLANTPTVAIENKIYTSVANNPFYFPSTGINTIGTGAIMGICSAAKALSEGQLGQFPLYAFATDGVWVLEVAKDGSYSTSQSIREDVCINSDSITQLDDAVLFATKRGIMLISGSQTVCTTDTIFSEAPFNVLELPSVDRLHTMLGHTDNAIQCLKTKPFLNFLADCRMVYDYVHQRVIVFNPTKQNGSPLYTYAYVYSLKSKMWGLTFSNLSSPVNSYPDAMAMTQDYKLVSFSDTDETECKGLYITRPLKLEAADIHKTISALIQRGHFQRGDVGTVLYGSRDLFTWHLIWSSKDHYLRGFRGTPYKYFRIVGLATLTDGKSIFGASVNFEPRHTNQLR